MRVFKTIDGIISTNFQKCIKKIKNKLECKQLVALSIKKDIRFFIFPNSSFFFCTSLFLFPVFSQVSTMSTYYFQNHRKNKNVWTGLFNSVVGKVTAPKDVLTPKTCEHNQPYMAKRVCAGVTELRKVLIRGKLESQGQRRRDDCGAGAAGMRGHIPRRSGSLWKLEESRGWILPLELPGEMLSCWLVPDFWSLDCDIVNLCPSKPLSLWSFVPEP